MSYKIPYRINEINIDNICYTTVKSSETKTIIYLKYMDSNKLKNIVFQTPDLFSIYNITKKNNSIYEIDIPLVGRSDTKTSRFIQFLNNIDSKIIKDARNNSSWFSGFPQQKTMKYQKIIRESIDNKHDEGIIRVKILKTNDFNTMINFNNKKVESLESDIPPNCWVKSILEIYAIWVNENGFGLFIRPILMNFKLTNTTIYDYKLIESDEVDELDDGLCTVQDNNDSVFIRSDYIDTQMTVGETMLDINITDTPIQDKSISNTSLSFTELRNKLNDDMLETSSIDGTTDSSTSE